MHATELEIKQEFFLCKGIFEWLHVKEKKEEKKEPPEPTMIEDLGIYTSSIVFGLLNE